MLLGCQACSNCSTRPCPPHSLITGVSRSIAPLCFELLFASFYVSRGKQLPTLGKRWREKKKQKIGFSLHSSSSANTDIVKQSAKHFALRGWTSGGTIIMTHSVSACWTVPVTRGAPGNAQSSIFVQWHPCNCHTTLSVPKGTLGNGEGYSDPHRVAQALRTDIKHKKNSSSHLLLESSFLSVRRKALYHAIFSDPPMYPRIVTSL